MILVSPKVELISYTKNAEQLIEQCGRVCYQSESKDSEAFIKRLISRGHLSVLEHASATCLIICDRGVTHELVRHRIASYSQESTRYCNYKKQVSYIFEHDLPKDLFDRLIKQLQDIETLYQDMIATGIAPQIARAILPNCLKTQIAITANFREWRHIFKLRRESTAHPDMRQVMNMAFNIFDANWPTIFGDLKNV